MWYLTALRFQSVSYFRELMLQTLIQRYDKNYFIFYPIQKGEITEILQAVRFHIL